jgi:hypothetical protein
VTLAELPFPTSTELSLQVQAALRTGGGPSGGGQVSRTVEDALRQGVSDDPLVVVLKEAVESAGRSRFPNPERVLAAVQAIVEVAHRYSADEAPEGIHQLFRDLPFTYAADISDTAKQQFRNDCLRKHEGREVITGPHISLGPKTGSRRRPHADGRTREHAQVIDARDRRSDWRAVDSAAQGMVTSPVSGCCVRP